MLKSNSRIVLTAHQQRQRNVWSLSQIRSNPERAQSSSRHNWNREIDKGVIWAKASREGQEAPVDHWDFDCAILNSNEWANDSTSWREREGQGIQAQAL